MVDNHFPQERVGDEPRPARKDDDHERGETGAARSGIAYDYEGQVFNSSQMGTHADIKTST